MKNWMDIGVIYQDGILEEAQLQENTMSLVIFK